MYPTINFNDSGGGTQNPLHAPYPSTSAASAAPARPDNPASPPARPGAQAPAFPTLQVAIDPKFCVAPPVRAPSQPPGEGGPAGGLAPPPPPGHAPPGSKEPLDLGLERKLLKDLEPSSSGKGGGTPGGGGGGALQPPREDPYDLLLRRYTAMGFSREEVAMALAIVGPDAQDDGDKIVDACRKYKSLALMGFKGELVAGALVATRGSEEEAVQLCLDAS